MIKRTTGIIDQKMQTDNYFRLAFEYQMQGDFSQAIFFYNKSLEQHPSGEAFTFLGWTYSFMGMWDKAIAACKKAIEIDPDLGNPWNDIGAYYIEMGKYDEAIPYLEQATQCRKYDFPYYPHFNLSRIYTKKGMLRRAEVELKKSLEYNSSYQPARDALDKIQREFN